MGGVEPTGEKKFVARGVINNHLVPGMWRPGHDFLAGLYRTPYKLPASQYEVLSSCSATWEKFPRGTIPDNAVQGGKLENGTILYVCRGNYVTINLGYVSPLESRCYYWRIQEGRAHEDFELLVSQGSSCGKWITVTDNDVPPNAVTASDDTKENKDCVGRRHISGNLIPGTLQSKLKFSGFYEGNQKNVEVPKFEVLVDCRSIWVHSSNGYIPHNAVKAGSIKGGSEFLYICRVTYDDNVISGRVYGNKGRCFVRIKGKEKSFENFEILVEA